MKFPTIAIVLGLLGVAAAIPSPASCPIECWCGSDRRVLARRRRRRKVAFLRLEAIVDRSKFGNSMREERRVRARIEISTKKLPYSPSCQSMLATYLDVVASGHWVGMERWQPLISGRLGALTLEKPQATGVEHYDKLFGSAPVPRQINFDDRLASDQSRKLCFDGSSTMWKLRVLVGHFYRDLVQ
ncbi:hypothetical protein DL93DRAFT_2103025 [Clavulina sp. PMI_390]|nr:hypothetical protein DL93DRAFT_2103025 [Clavulina sp. PMI_390]